jgi:hypothetical protein
MGLFLFIWAIHFTTCQLPNKNMFQKIAKSIVNLFEYRWELDKEKNERKRMLAEFRKQTICDIIRKKGI